MLSSELQNAVDIKDFLDYNSFYKNVLLACSAIVIGQCPSFVVRRPFGSCGDNYVL